MTETHHICVPQEAKYCTLGQLTDRTTQVWFVLHGYGQLAQYFIRKFQPLTNAGHFVVAPEATSRFYLNSHSGRVGATWMTKEDRETDINNYVTYLDTLASSLDIPATCKINVVGFSQGAATASRWIAQGSTKPHRLLLWAGIFPPDMNILEAKEVFQDIEVVNLYGTNDEFLNDEKLKEQQSIVSELGIDCELIKFDGNHDIHQDTLIKFL